MLHRPHLSRTDFSRAVAEPLNGFELHISACTAAQLSGRRLQGATLTECGALQEDPSELLVSAAR